jgi:hypothetical protein
MLNRIDKFTLDLPLIGIVGDDILQIAASFAVLRRVNRELDVIKRDVVLPTPAEDIFQLA